MIDTLTLTRIRQMHPDLMAKTLIDYGAACKVLGPNVLLRFSHTYRSFALQNSLYAKRPKVTNAKGGQSFHNYGLAFDIVLLYDKDKNHTYKEASWSRTRDGDDDRIADWLEVTKVFTSRGWQNGFLRNGRKWDFPHFQFTFGYNWRTLLEMHKAENFIKGTNYVKL